MAQAPMDNPTLQISWTDYASTNLDARIRKLKEQDRPIALDARTEAIQFLRGTSALASQILPAFYMQVGARGASEATDVPHWQAVRAAHLEMSSLLTISLTCRAIFDDSRKGMTGKRFAQTPDATLETIAEYWGTRSKRPPEDAMKALGLLRELFGRCARPQRTLLDAPSLLERRIALLKYHANHQAAHLSLKPFLFDIIDLVHVVAAVALVGAIIVDFDDGARAPSYYDSIDDSGWQAAKSVFPELPIERLFQRFDIHQQAELYWRREWADGLDLLLNQLPAAIGYWDGTPSQI